MAEFAAAKLNRNKRGLLTWYEEEERSRASRDGFMAKYLEC
jgi:hypothetical protein